ASLPFDKWGESPLSDGISGGGETTGHNPGSKHYTGQAADFSYRLNTNLVFSEKKVMCCAASCGFQYGNAKADHFHLQTVPGKGDSSGALPKIRADVSEH